MAIMCSERLTIEERDSILDLAWLNQKEFARVLEIDAHTMSKQLNRGMYKDLYVKIGASRKFDAKKVKKFLE